MGSAAAFLTTLFVFILYGRPFDFMLSGLHLPLIVSIGAMAACLMSGQLIKKLNVKTTTPLIVLTGWMALSTVFSVWPGGSTRIFIDHWIKQWLPYVLVVVAIQTTRQATTLLRVLAVSLLLASIFGLVLGQSDEGRLSLPAGQYANPNYFALAMASGFVIVWSFVHGRGLNFFLRALGFAYLPVFLFLVLESQSRAAFLATLLAFGAFFVRGSLAAKVKLLIAVVILGGLAFSVANTRTISRLKDAAALASSSSSEGPDGSTQSRFELLKDSIRLTFANPLLGVGPGMFMVAQNTMARDEGEINGTWQGTHNTYTQFSSEVGIPALLMFVIVIYYCVSSILATGRLNGSTVSSQRDRNHASLMSLQGLWVLYIVCFCFFHIAFTAFLPTLIALTMATTGAITRDCRAIQAAQMEAAG